MHGIPGHISVIVSETNPSHIQHIKDNLLKDNPMVSAVYLSAKNWESCKELSEWAKKNNLKTGLSADEMGLEDVKAALESGFVEFVRLNIKKHPETKKKAGLIRSSGIKHEFVFGLEENDSSKAEEAYLFVSPCDSFVVEAHPKLKDETKNLLMGLASKYKSMGLRFLK
ncbi:MAG: hypothetical protein PHH61_02445 [Candidatus Nanoarchaeia archaeon]|nr:hypothetical protein [Candidatus Nanoarchaeia archaeon]